MAGLDLASIRTRAQSLFHGFTRGQKTMLGVAVAAALLGAVVFLRWASAPSYAPLYSGLPGDEAASVTAELDSMGIAYRLQGGDTILVPRDEVYQTRIDLSAKGLPSDGNPGYDLLDHQGITTSEFRQRVDYQRALEGELAKTIGSIEGIADVDVHLVLPKDDLFSDDAVRPTASVLLTTKGKQTPPSRQVQAIVHLVASSVEGLQASDVAVADQAGHILATPGEDGLAAAAGDARSEQTGAFEQGLARSLQDLITPIAGAGRARVQVSADLDFDQRTTTKEDFSEPGTAAVASETTKDETYAGGGAGVGGVLGTDTGATGTGGAANGTDYSRTESQRTYAVDKVTEQVHSAPGAVERLSVAVLLDSKAKVDESAVEDLVAAAAGIDLDRGDQIQVTRAAFDESALPAAAEADDDGASPLDGVLPIARVVAVVLLVGVVLLLAQRSARRSAAIRYPLAIPIESGLADRRLVDDPAELGAAEAAERALGPSPEDQRQMAVQSQIGDLIDRQPDEVAQVLRGWLAERRS
jgi:flagellar M-ring protein FliF